MNMENVIKKIVVEYDGLHSKISYVYYIRKKDLNFISKMLFSYNFFIEIQQSPSGSCYALLPVYLDIDLKVVKTILYCLGCKLFKKFINDKN